MPQPKTGYTDSYHQSRINHLAGTTYPAAITTPYVGLYLGKMPLSDGTGATDVVRAAVTWAAPVQDPNTQRWYIQPTAPLTFPAIPALTSGEIIGWGVYAASSGGTPVYADAVPSPFPVVAGQVLTLPAAAFRAWSEGTSAQP